jgi:hypothetical protein
MCKCRVNAQVAASHDANGERENRERDQIARVAANQERKKLIEATKDNRANKLLEKCNKLCLPTHCPMKTQ